MAGVEPHHQAGGVPAAGNQALVRAVRGGFRVDVEVLRIELLGEFDDGGLVDGGRGRVLDERAPGT
jgi:hypothetical protein